MTRWMANARYIAQIRAAAPDLAGMWNGGTFALSSPTSPPPLGLAADGPVPVGIYRSFDKLMRDCAAGLIHPDFGWLLADYESWPDTDLAARQDPFAYLRKAAQYAHRYGPWRLIAAPARDLAGVCTAQPKTGGESDTDWYLRTGMAARAARYADAVSVQSQAETITGRFAGMVSQASAQARNANPYAIRLCGISTRYGTAEQMAAAVQSVVPAQASGAWLNLPDDDVAKAVAFLRLVL